VGWLICVRVAVSSDVVAIRLSLGQYVRPMLVAYLESFKHVGHFFPLSVLRIFVGWTFLQAAWDRLQSDYLTQPRLAAAITEFAPMSAAPDWYKDFLDAVVVPNWQLFAYCVVYFGFLVGLSMIVGLFVRPVALLAAIVSLNFVFTTSAESTPLHVLHVFLFIVLAWMGAGRCMGLDYFFYKRDRGLWW
jgi:thiosulfate dehydrogenase (quinone) large subunit